MDEQHPVPRQITSFEFKLVGFMTLRQFIYLLVFLPIAYIVIRLFPIPVLNFVLGAAIAALGVALAFLPINDRPLDVFLINLYKRLTSPTQYIYKKNSGTIDFLEDAAMAAQEKETHLDSKQKLAKYLGMVKDPQAKTEEKEALEKQSITAVLNEPPAKEKKERPLFDLGHSDKPKPFVVGVVKNSKQMPLPGVLLYIKDQRNTPIRLLKTNPNGVFATYSELTPGEYTIEIKDPKDSFFFDTMRVHLEKNNPRPLEFYSREIL